MSVTVTAQVSSGHRLELDVPQFQDGQLVRITIEPLAADDKTAPGVEGDLAAWFATLPPNKRTRAQWDEYDRQLRAERDAWDRD